ncbi:hypothetical protein L3Q82_001449 [Scortum barcoo]|uniref:Uncharacterized protein n=1 Tax=Scortum barcoo TaxID=214431 RepID=A0ACB8WAM8_9TELE|nr:hypothetical protein L3Q82_001449 [Scortum barcoo]
MGSGGLCLRAVRSLYDRSRSLVRIAGNDVVLMASSGQDLQHVLERFAAKCEVAGMRISTSKSEAMILDRKRVAYPLSGDMAQEEARGMGQIEVSSEEESDYVLVFCPIVSRVGTDIEEALGNVHAGKPAVLMVMHHTFSHDHVVADSRRLVDDMKVPLTADFLFYEGRLLKSERNTIAFHDIQKFFGVTPFQVSGLRNIVTTVCICCSTVSCHQGHGPGRGD